jgi:hypothetical protein
MARLANTLWCVLLSSCAAQEDVADDAAQSEFAVPAPCSSGDQRTDQRHRDALEVWIDLSLPALSSMSDQKSRDALHARIREQQDAVMTELVSLGAVELARVVQVRNAIAVRIPSSALEQARAIAGVERVRVVKDRKRTPPCSSRN